MSKISWTVSSQVSSQPDPASSQLWIFSISLAFGNINRKVPNSEIFLKNSKFSEECTLLYFEFVFKSNQTFLIVYPKGVFTILSKSKVYLPWYLNLPFPEAQN